MKSKEINIIRNSNMEWKKKNPDKKTPTQTAAEFLIDTEPNTHVYADLDKEERMHFDKIKDKLSQEEGKELHDTDVVRYLLHNNNLKLGNQHV